MTEDDAKAKWCPFGRIQPMQAAINRGSKSTDWTYCIGSNCMAWRWEIKPCSVLGHDPDGKIIREEHSGEGFCGLAGKPE